jgi:GTP-binding protein LepA
MDIERERGITIKAQNVRLPWRADGRDHVLHLIDTPGHVDFTYEVSRSLAACEGTLLLVDAAQGIEAQTLANLYLALENDLHIIPVLNKIDLPAAQPDKYAEEISKIIGCDPDDVLRISAKTGEGVPDVLNAICRDVPAPTARSTARPAHDLRLGLRLYRGVITYVRVFDGQLSTKDRGLMMSTQNAHEILEVGVVSPT